MLQRQPSSRAGQPQNVRLRRRLKLWKWGEVTRRARKRTRKPRNKLVEYQPGVNSRLILSKYFRGLYPFTPPVTVRTTVPRRASDEGPPPLAATEVPRPESFFT